MRWAAAHDWSIVKRCMCTGVPVKADSECINHSMMVYTAKNVPVSSDYNKTFLMYKHLYTKWLFMTVATNSGFKS